MSIAAWHIISGLPSRENQIIRRCCVIASMTRIALIHSSSWVNFMRATGDYCGTGSAEPCQSLISSDHKNVFLKPRE
jgi:hypothetical protein